MPVRSYRYVGNVLDVGNSPPKKEEKEKKKVFSRSGDQRYILKVRYE
jgi:hypothetical protein